MKLLKRITLAIAATMVIGFPALSDEVLLRADPWCPYNCKPGSDAPGFMIEIAREALALHGNTVVYENAPWERVLEMARTGVIAGAVGAVPDEAPELLYGEPLGTYEDAVAVRSGENINPADTTTFEGWRIGAISGYEYYGPIAAYIEANREDQTLVQYASGAQPLLNNLRKLRAGRIDMVAEVTAVLEYELMQSGLDDELGIIPTSTREHVFIGFSPTLPKAKIYLEQLDEGIATLRKNGRLAEILRKYGAIDWVD